MRHEFSVKEQGLEVRVRELEESARNSCSDLNRLLVAQQRTSKRWKEEAQKLTGAFEHKVGSLKYAASFHTYVMWTFLGFVYMHARLSTLLYKMANVSLGCKSRRRSKNIICK